MRTVPIEGSDITEATPSNGKIFVAGFIKSPRQHIRIKWTVDGYSGSTECEAWKGQHEIELLNRAGYLITAIE